MTYYQEIKNTIGVKIFEKLEKEANKEVAISLKEPLVIDTYQNYYRQRFLPPLLTNEYKVFFDLNLWITPFDIVNILFRVKMLYASNNEQEYRQKTSAWSLYDETSFCIPWNYRSTKKYLEVVEEYFERIQSFSTQKSLVIEVWEFQSLNWYPEPFFNNLLSSIKIPGRFFLSYESAENEYKKITKRMKYNETNVKEYYLYPSVIHTSFWSGDYCYHFSSMVLRTILNLIRIGCFIYPWQISFWDTSIKIEGVKTPVFLWKNSRWCFNWKEDEKEPWNKIPDWWLRISFWYKWIQKIRFDERNYANIEMFFLDNVIFFNQNPWSSVYLNDIAPVLDLLNSSTQVQDLWAKLLLIYCCLEHLFVPKWQIRGNKKSISESIQILDSSLLWWFERIYTLRCSYAHKWFIQKNEETLSLIMESMNNIVKLLRLKIENNSQIKAQRNILSKLTKKVTNCFLFIFSKRNSNYF